MWDACTMQSQKAFFTSTAIAAAVLTALLAACSDDGPEVVKSTKDAGPGSKLDGAIDGSDDQTMPPEGDAETRLSCAEVLTCAKDCMMDKTCSQACVANGTVRAQELVGAITACLITTPNN